MHTPVACKASDQPLGKAVNDPFQNVKNRAACGCVLNLVVIGGTIERLYQLRRTQVTVVPIVEGCCTVVQISGLVLVATAFQSFSLLTQPENNEGNCPLRSSDGNHIGSAVCHVNDGLQLSVRTNDLKRLSLALFRMWPRGWPRSVMSWTT